jgi:multiple sugar transport system permease protein
MKRKNKTFNLVAVIVLLAFSVALIAPFVWMLSVSFERYANLQPPFPPRLIPQEISLFNYRLVVENGTLFKAYGNSFVIAFFSVGLTLFTSLLGGYAFSKGDFYGKKALFFIVLSTMMVPLESRLIPMYMMFSSWNMANTFLPLILTMPQLGFSILLVKQYFDNLPNSLREAAWIDGATEHKIFYSIFLPLCGPMVATLVILVFMGSWNDFLWPLVVLTSQKLQTIPIYLSKFSLEDGTAYAGLSMALSAASIVPVILVFLVFQKYIIQSVAMSGIKGE